MLALTIILGLFSCLFIVFIFSLMKAGKRADEDEERILSIIQEQLNYYKSCDNEYDNAKECSGVVIQAR